MELETGNGKRAAGNGKPGYGLRVTDCALRTNGIADC